MSTGQAYEYKVGNSAADSHQSDPYWLAIVLPFAFLETYDRMAQAPIEAPNPDNAPASNSSLLGLDELFPNKDNSYVTEAFAAGPQAVLKAIIIDNDCIGWSTSSSKDNHVSSLTMTLVPSGIDYTSRISGEDWILFWAFNDFASYRKTKNLILNNKRANGFDSGLKFIGKVQNIFKNKSVDATGHKTISYSLSAAGFAELDTLMYSDARIEESVPSATVAWAKLGEVTRMFSEQQAGIISAEDAIYFLLSICLGTGPGTRAKTGGFTGPDLRSMTPNDAYLIPKELQPYLMSATSQPYFKDIGFTYVDLLKVFIGTMEYTADGFQPKIKDTEGWMSFGTKPLGGIFALPVINFNMETVWSVINTFVATPMYEAVAALRVVDDNGEQAILPTITFRQIPLSSPEFCKNDPGTGFLTVPRWIISDSLVNSIQIGTSNAMRCNYVHIVPTIVQNATAEGKAQANFLSVPTSDSFDIKRAGLRARNQTVGCTFETGEVDAAQRDFGFYNRLMSDILFGAHLKYSGSIVTRGIQEPICEGDNCVVDGIIFHIERVTHSGNIDGSGKKDFNTTLSVSNGVSVQSDIKNSLIFGKRLIIDGSAGNTAE